MRNDCTYKDTQPFISCEPVIFIPRHNTEASSNCDRGDGSDVFYSIAPRGAGEHSWSHSCPRIRCPAPRRSNRLIEENLAKSGAAEFTRLLKPPLFFTPGIESILLVFHLVVLSIPFQCLPRFRTTYNLSVTMLRRFYRPRCLAPFALKRYCGAHN
jgi:hypothetical protein